MDKQAKPRNMPTQHVHPSSMCAVRPAGCVWVVDRVSPHTIDNHVKCEYSNYMRQVLRVTYRRSLKMKGRTKRAMLMASDFFFASSYTFSPLQDEVLRL